MGMGRYRNLMEILLEELFDEMEPQLNCCTCETCRSDIIALTLNSLPPRYVCTPTGEIMTKLKQITAQSKADAMAALARVAEMVKAAPRH